MAPSPSAAAKSSSPPPCPDRDADITGRDTDGELLATPTEWMKRNRRSTEDPHSCSRRPQPGRPPVSATARYCASRKPTRPKARPIAGRVIKVIAHARTRLLGIFRKLPNGGGRLVPVDKKQAGRELNIASADTGGAEDGDLVSVDLVRTRGYGLASGKVKSGSARSRPRKRSA